MILQKGTRLFVRLDYAIEGTKFCANDYTDHIAYVRGIAKERYFLGGGCKGGANSAGGICVFEAADFDDAQTVASGDPLIMRGLFRFELLEWDIFIASESKVLS